MKRLMRLGSIHRKLCLDEGYVKKLEMATKPRMCVEPKKKYNVDIGNLFKGTSYLKRVMKLFR